MRKIKKFNEVIYLCGKVVEAKEELQKEGDNDKLDTKIKFSIDKLQNLLTKVDKECLKLPRKVVQNILAKSPNPDTAVFNMWSDGGSNPNPGPGGAGFMICGPLGKKQIILKGRLYLGKQCTNNIARVYRLHFWVKVRSLYWHKRTEDTCRFPTSGKAS